jgi:hypothetical protein
MKQFALTIEGPNGPIEIDPPVGVPTGGLDGDGGGLAGMIARYGLTLLLVAAVLLSLVYLVLGGIQWITSGGDKSKLQTARNKMMYAIIGLVVSFLAYFIVGLVTAFFRVDYFGG